MSSRHKCFTDAVSWFGKPSSTVSESQASVILTPHLLISAGGQRHLGPCPEPLYFSLASRPPARSQRMHLVPVMTWSPPRQGRRERRQDRAESDCPENSSRSQSSGESRVRMSPTGSQTEPPACLCPGYTLPDLRLDSRRPGDPPTVCVSPVWATGTQGHVGMSRAPSS